MSTVSTVQVPPAHSSATTANTSTTPTSSCPDFSFPLQATQTTQPTRSRHDWTTNNNNNKLELPKKSSPPPRSPHRRHAHKRSGAVSQHDIVLDFKTAQNTKLGPALVPTSTAGTASTSTESSPSLTFASSSNSSLPFPPSASSSPSTATTKVSFVDTPSSGGVIPRATTTGQPKPRPQSAISTHSTASVASAPPVTKSKKHKRVKSWAGSLFFRSKHKKHNNHTNNSAQDYHHDHHHRNELHSSSYIPALNLINMSDEEDDQTMQPIIDLDDALDADPVQPTRGRMMMRSHRRTESAPEFAYPGRTGMKRKIIEEAPSSESIIEEDEDEPQEESSPAPKGPSAASSQVSLNSTASSISNRDRGRYSRNYSSGLLALGLVKADQLKGTTPPTISKQSQNSSEEEKRLSASVTDQEKRLSGLSMTDQEKRLSGLSMTDQEKRLSGLSMTDEEKRLSATISSSGTITPPPPHGGGPSSSHHQKSKRLSIANTITEKDLRSQASSIFSLGEPGPEVHFDPTKQQQQQRRSFLKLRRGSSNASFDISATAMKRRSLPTRLLKWVKDKAS